MSEASPLEVTCAAVKAKLDRGEEFLFVDCREADEFAVAKINGTTLLPMSELATRVGELEPHKDAEIVIHCHHGGRSLRVATWLRQQGYTKAASMSGGIDQWATDIDTSIARY